MKKWWRTEMILEKGLPMPEVTDGVLRAVFSFFFLGLIVSELGLALRLPLFPAPPVPPPTATCGMELTVSVSTVIFFVDPSPDGFPLAAAPLTT
jgi:hypothetical protein